MTPRIYRYVVRCDSGSAPRPYGNVCSLSICKPRVRKAASVGDWIIGVRSRAPDKVVYVMQVAESLPLGKYWQDARFRDRQPDASPVPDNIYRPDGTGNLIQVPNVVHDAGNQTRDISGRNALIGSRFWYFGASSPPLPTELIHLVHDGVGHAVHKRRRPDDVKRLEQWLATWPCGVHGRPINATPGVLAWLAEMETGERFPPTNGQVGRCHKASDLSPIATTVPFPKRRC
ncbi:hypothetical protein SAMN05216345_105261 [Cupriavidus sp. YR651]|uniref:Nmad2 family putative nucleotide modification protein n=1 Tax=Cupriavidus sp. YR651 TaxID=1855315 RepID=UPI0008905EFD|nr:hypothetical protein SAMN05216345_105261 [Cupriavidus sp. YR651]